jgi:hypothetical protein
MNLFFTTTTHLLIVVGMLILIALTFRMIAVAPSRLEQAIRVIALAAGFLLNVGAKRLHMDIPTLLSNSLSVANPLAYGAVEVVAPAVTGLTAAYFLLKGLRDQRSQNKGVRLIVFLTSLFVVLFGDVYASAITTDIRDERLLLPNLSFALALMFYVITRWDPEADLRNGWRSDIDNGQ